MRKLSFFIVVLLIISSFTAISIGSEAKEQYETINIDFVKPIIIEKEPFLELEIEGTNNYIFKTGLPMLPVYTKTLSLPFGAKILDINYEIEEIKTTKLNNKILPSPNFWGAR